AGVGANMWFVGLAVSGLGTILGAVNMTTTILTLRAPGMTMFRMPIFTWNILITGVMVLMVFPILAAALLVAMARIGKTISTMTPVIRMFQVKIGIRNIVMPGARSVRM